jgi:hypothetical protein
MIVCLVWFSLMTQEGEIGMESSAPGDGRGSGLSLLSAVKPTIRPMGRTHRKVSIPCKVPIRLRVSATQKVVVRGEYQCGRMRRCGRLSTIGTNDAIRSGDEVEG